MKTKKIIKVLKFVKDYCKRHKDCDLCPFRNSGVCDYASPNQWDIRVLRRELKESERIEINDESGNEKK